MRTFALMVGLLVTAVFFTVASPSAHAVEKHQNKPHKQRQVVTIKSGDSLSKIARKHKTTYKRLFYANKKIKNPDIIYPGDKIQVPGKNEKLKKRPMPGSVISSRPEANEVENTNSTQERSNYVHQTPVQSYVGSSVWDKLAACESGGNWSINTGNGYYGGLQFSLSSWRAVGGSGYPNQASRTEQIKRAEILRSSGGWGHWPACAAQLGLL